MSKNRAIFVDATAGEIIERDTKPTLKEMQDFVGGYIEPVRGCRYGGKAVTLVANQDGLLLGLPTNLVATKLYRAIGGEVIVGNVIILEGFKI